MNDQGSRAEGQAVNLGPNAVLEQSHKDWNGMSRDQDFAECCSQ